MENHHFETRFVVVAHFNRSAVCTHLWAAEKCTLFFLIIYWQTCWIRISRDLSSSLFLTVWCTRLLRNACVSPVYIYTTLRARMMNTTCSLWIRARVCNAPTYRKVNERRRNTIPYLLLHERWKSIIFRVCHRGTRVACVRASVVFDVLWMRTGDARPIAIHKHTARIGHRANVWMLGGARARARVCKHQNKRSPYFVARFCFSSLF